LRTRARAERPLIPSKGWASYASAVRSIGEFRATNHAESVPFLRDLNFVEPSDPPRLTSIGAEYFQAAFIRGDEQAAVSVLQNALMRMPPVIAVAQLLDGVAGRTRDSVDTVLRSQGFGQNLKDRDLGFFVALLSRAGIISYVKSTGAVTVLVHLAQEEVVPASVFISPGTPYANRVWLRRILEEAIGDLRWLDKHFTSAAFEAIWEAVDGNRVSRVRILSLYLPDVHGSKRVRRDFVNLHTEFAARGVTIEWRVIDSTNIRDTHDRWVIGDDSARNVPNVNAIMSGQHSELNYSNQRAELSVVFDDYWSKSVSIDEIWRPDGS
jgi:hypothetical protein